MQISSSMRAATPALKSTSFAKPQAEAAPATPEDSFTFGDDSKGAFIALGAGTGALGIGGTAALAMGSAKSFMSGHPLIGTGLAVGTLAFGATVGMMTFMGAAMSTDSGESAGLNAYLAGGALTTAGAALAIF